jgi:hypothetical protein
MPRTIVSVTHNIYKDPAGTSVAFDPNAWDAVQAGDLLIFIEASASASTGRTLTGWTLKYTITAFSGTVLNVWYKWASGSEPATYTYSWTGNSTLAASCLAVRGLKGSGDPFNAETDLAGSGASHTVSSVDPTRPKGMHLILNVINAYVSWTNPLGYQLWSTTGATGRAIATWALDWPTDGPTPGNLVGLNPPATGRTFSIALADSNSAPGAPVLNSPANGEAVDLAATPTFDWTHTPGNVDEVQSAWALRRKVGAGAYEYYRDSDDTWQATEQKNVSTTTQITFPAAKWSNGTTYQWSVKTWDDEDTVGSYASDITVVGSAAATVTVTGPADPVTTTTSPTVTWSFTDPESDPQQEFEVKIEQGGFTSVPGSGTEIDTSGAVVSVPLREWTITEILEHGATYRAFVRVKTAGQWSNWAFDDFTLDLDPPAAPSVSATYDPETATATIVVQGHDNLLSTNEASLETDTTGWTAGASSDIARVTSWSSHGVASLSLTRTGTTGTATASTPTGLSGKPVEPLTEYTVLATVRSATVLRQVRVNILWYKSDGSASATPVSNGVLLASATATDTDLVTTATSPADAAFAAIEVEAQGVVVGELHLFDALSLAPGDSTEWARGGIAADTTFTVWRTDDENPTAVEVRDGIAVAHDGAPTQVATVLDYEVTPNITTEFYATAQIETV